MALLSTDDIETIDAIQREPMEVWGGRTLWVWGLSFRQFTRLLSEAQRPDPDGRLRFDPEWVSGIE